LREATSERVAEREAEKVVRWRREQLIAAGYDAKSAARLAKRLEVDLHAAVDLVANGCPPATAVRILV
jgi:coenzyme F420-reducing hydrogenase gamma subunit